MRIAFAGTPAFARVALEALHAARHDVVCVLTQPDRPAGRGMKLQASEVKRAAEAMGVPVLQPAGLRLDGRYAAEAHAARDQLDAMAPDAMVVAAYGLLLPAWTLALPRHGCLNIHASLLPRWRGAAPIHRAIEAGDRETGVCIMQMDAGLDTGDVLFAEAVTIAPDATTGSLHDVLAENGARAIVAMIEQKTAGTDRAVPQSANGVTYAAKIDKRESAVDWRQPAADIERRLRAFDPFPGATAVTHDGETIKLWRGHVVAGEGQPGSVLGGDHSLITVACGAGALALTDLQRPGARRGGVASLWTHWQGIAADGPPGFRLPTA